MRRTIDAADRDGRRTASTFWSVLIVGLAMVGAGTSGAIAGGWPVAGVAFGSFGLLLVYFAAAVPLAMAGRAMKLTVFGAVAARDGLDYAPLARSFPASTDAWRALFGEEPVGACFTDLFRGTDEDGRAFASCEAFFVDGGGGQFNGRLFVLARQGQGQAQVIAMPLTPSWVDPATALTFDSDPGFAGAFRIHATVPEQARLLLGPDARRMLLDLRRRGAVRFYAAPTLIFVAIAGRKGFTPGLGFRFRPGELRVRRMYDDLADSLTILRRLKSDLGPDP